MSITQDQINSLASRSNLIAFPLEEGSDRRTRCFLTRDLDDSAVYFQALISLPTGANGPVQAYCGSYGVRNLDDDGSKEYPDIEQAIADIDKRFKKLDEKYGQTAFIVHAHHRIGVREYQATNYEAEVIQLALQSFGHLIRSMADFAKMKRMSFGEFAALIEAHYDESNARTKETIQVLRAVHNRHTAGVL